MSDDAMLIRPTHCCHSRRMPPPFLLLSSSTLVPDILNRGSSQVKDPGVFPSLCEDQDSGSPIKSGMTDKTKCRFLAKLGMTTPLIPAAPNGRGLE